MINSDADSLESYIQQMNNGYGSERYKGFLGCRIHTAKPTVIAYAFDTEEHADNFIFSRQIEGVTFRMEHNYFDAAEIMEYR